MGELTLQQWFKRADTPAEHSPVGVMMRRILEKYPHMSFADARAEANKMLDQAAGRQHYQLPKVYTPEEQAERMSKFKERVRNGRKGPESADGQGLSASKEQP